MATAIFDVLGTLFSLEGARGALARHGAPPHTLERWFGESLRDYFAWAHAGGYVPLAEVLKAALPRTLEAVGAHPSAAAEEAALRSLRELDPASGAVEGCRLLLDAGWQLVALTNGGRASTEALLERGGLRAHFSAVISCEELKVAKPAAATYAAAVAAAEGEAWMIAAHVWDIAGAARAGLSTAWIATTEPRTLEPALPAPDLRAHDLHEAAALLVERVGPAR